MASDCRGQKARKSNPAALEALSSLCLVSKTMNLVARPSLFRSIVVGDDLILIHLYRTLIQNTDLGRFVRMISFTHTMISSASEHPTPTHLGLLNSFLKRDDELLLHVSDLCFTDKISYRSHCDLICILYLRILSHTPRLATPSSTSRSLSRLPELACYLRRYFLPPKKKGASNFLLRRPSTMAHILLYQS